MTIRHFLSLVDFDRSELNHLLNRAIEMKTQKRYGGNSHTQHKALALLFEKPSTRTRVSFEVAMSQLEGNSIFLSSTDSQLGRGEPIEDTAKVLSRMVDIVAIRAFHHETIRRFADNASIPTINALSDDFHPCQVLADMQTFVEKRGSIQGKTVAWIGDGNNMCQSYINAAKQFDFELRIACPEAYHPKKDLLSANSQHVAIVKDPLTAVKNADLVVTDVWASMGQESEKQKRKQQFRSYQVTMELLDQAKPAVLFMHCLPAHRGEEVSDAVMNDPRSVVWDEAENRLHAQKALIEFLLAQ